MSNVRTNTQELRRLSKNNDPLAHVYLLMESYDGVVAEHRIYEEFITDIGERLPEQPFRRTFTFNVLNGDLISETGLNMRHFLQSGYDAAVADVSRGEQPQYAAARAEALLRQGQEVENWAMSEDEVDIIFYSLCPTSEELSMSDAKRQNFKPDRMMASVQRYSKEQGQITMEAYSLDGMYLEDIATLHNLTTYGDIAKTTLEQLLQGITIEKSITTDGLIHNYDALKSDGSFNNVTFVQGVDMNKFKEEANKAVESCPEAWSLYLSTIQEIARTFQAGGRVTGGLETIATNQASSFVGRGLLIPDYLRVTKGQQYSLDTATEFLNHLRKEAIPHYIVTSWNSDNQKIISSDSGFSDAGADSVASGVSYNGGCPESGTTTITQETSSLNEVFGKQNKNILSCVTCPFCGHTVDAQLTSKTIACPREECGAIVDLKTNERIDKKQVTLYKPHADSAQVEITKNDERNTTQSTTTQQISMQIANVQDNIWVTKYKIFNQKLSDEEKEVLYNELSSLYEIKNTLLRQKF